MSDREMTSGMRLFLYPGGAENLDVEQLLKIRDRCIEVLQVKNVPQGKTVHYYANLNTSQVACKALWVSNTTDDNATIVTDYVSCGSCKRTLSFRKATGEDVEGKERRVSIIHFEELAQNYWGYGLGAACGNYSGDKISKKISDVTCQSCTRTRSYKAAKKKSDGAKKAAVTRKKKKNWIKSIKKEKGH